MPKEVIYSLLFIALITIYIKGQTSIPTAALSHTISTEYTSAEAGKHGVAVDSLQQSVAANNLILLKKPYSVSPTAHSVRIVWETPLNTSKASIVEYGPTKKLGSSITGPDGWLIQGEGYIHEVTIDNLNPFTRYYYRVSNGSAFDEDINILKTAPLPGANFRLASLSDLHDNNAHIWEHLSSRIASFSPDAVVFIGDLLNDGHLRTTWSEGFFIPGNPLLSVCTSIYAIGNHETETGLPITFYDYFSLPTHASNGEDSRCDPTGEAYYSMNYGDAKIIAMNANGDSLSPSFSAGSAQYIWLENEIKTSQSKWLFIFCHVNVLSTSYHGQYSADQKEYLLPLYEKYAALGKHILVFGGDEHNFEHLYKAGVNYVRPGCGNSMTRGRFNMADMPYSIYFRQTPGFSTMDMSDSGNIVTLLARDTTGSVFYSASFDARQSTLLPSLYFTSPGPQNDTASNEYKLQWTDWVSASDSANTYINIYYTTDTNLPGTMIAGNVKLNDPQNSYIWDTKNLPRGNYFVYAILSNGQSTPIIKYATGKVIIIPDMVRPPSVGK